MKHPHTIIIAEAGVNHNGSIDTAIEMVHKAAEAGADYIKFQTFQAERIVSASAPQAKYQRTNCNGDGTQLSMLKALQLDYNDFARLAEECGNCGIGFMSTPFDLQSIDFLSTIQMDYWKIPSGEITDLPYIRHIASKGGCVIMSTGMSTLQEVQDAIHVLSAGGISRDKIYLLHCTTQYPAPFESVNLRAMHTLATLGCAGVGYSDHTQGTTVPIAAVALGASIIEKHFTLDRNMPGPDHKASLNVEDLRLMVTHIRETELSLGSSEKTVTDTERSNIAVARKSIVAARTIYRGELLSDDNLTTKRPATGLSPMLWDSVTGTRAIRDFMPDEPIEICL